MSADSTAPAIDHSLRCMKTHTLNYSADKRIRLLIVDDSELFRKFIGELLAESTVISIVGEAENGRDGLTMLESTNPDVVLLDMEMPVMDGMSVLRRVMDHDPVPVVMVSGLSREGSARSFDALKQGAVDFIGKDALHPRKGIGLLRKELLYRLLCASRLQIQKRPMEPYQAKAAADRQPPGERIVFCEDCGARNVIDADKRGNGQELRCIECGDLLDGVVITRYRRVTSVGVIGAGHGGTANLLNIVPQLPVDCPTTLIAVLHQPASHIDLFARYLDSVSSVKVIRLTAGMNIEGGNCYIAAAQDTFCMVSHSTNFTIRKGSPEAGHGPFDLMLGSLSTVMKNRLFVLTLSGQQLDGDKGVKLVKRNEGYVAVLNAAGCLCKELGENILKKSDIDRIVTEQDCVDLICRFQDGAGSSQLNATSSGT